MMSRLTPALLRWIFSSAPPLHPTITPRNKIHPGEFNYGGGHVIEELAAGRDIRLEASAYGADCYPKKKLETLIDINDLNEAVLFNIRSACQNSNVAVNLSEKTLYTYMGVLKPGLGNANYCSAGQLSPLLTGKFLLTEPVAPLPGVELGITFEPLKKRPI